MLVPRSSRFLSLPPWQRAVGSATLAAGITTLTATAAVAVLVAGSVTLAAGSNTVTATPAATLVAATTIGAGSQALTVLAPTATPAPGAVTRSAGTQTVQVAAAGATAMPSRTLAAGVQEMAVTAPTAAPFAGAATLAAGTQSILVSAPATVEGGVPATLQAGVQAVTVQAPIAVLVQILAPVLPSGGGMRVSTPSFPFPTLRGPAQRLVVDTATVLVSAPEARITMRLALRPNPAFIRASAPAVRLYAPDDADVFAALTALEGLLDAGEPEDDPRRSLLVGV